jgi:hypothetical protein
MTEKENRADLNFDEYHDKLKEYYARQSKTVTVISSRKAYKCYEALVLADGKRVSSGFGKSESDAKINAIKTTLGAIQKSADAASSTGSLSENGSNYATLEKFLRGNGLGDYYA